MNLLTINPSAPQLANVVHACTHKSIFKHVCATAIPRGAGVREGNNGCDYAYGTNREHQYNVYQQEVSHASRDVVWSFQDIRQAEGKYTSIYDCWNDEAYYP